MNNNNGAPNNNYGYAYSVARPQARNTQPLTPEQIAQLRQDSNAFDMKINTEDLWRSACTHKEKNGNSTLIQNNDGSYTCTICHETFRMCENSHEEVQNAVNLLIDMLQTSKTIYLDAPEDLVRQYYQMIPLLKKFPDLWDRALKNFEMYYNAISGGVSPMSPGYSGFMAMQNLLTNPNPFIGGYPQMPGMAQQQMNPCFTQAPMGYPMQMNPQNMNPMAFGVPSGIPNPTMQTAQAAPGVGVMPGTPQAAPVQQTPAATTAQQQTTEVQQQQVFNV